MLYIYIYILVSINGGTPSYHPFWIGIFPNQNHPAATIKGYPLYGNSPATKDGPIGLEPLTYHRLNKMNITSYYIALPSSKLT